MKISTIKDKAYKIIYDKMTRKYKLKYSDGSFGECKIQDRVNGKLQSLKIANEKLQRLKIAKEA